MSQMVETPTLATWEVLRPGDFVTYVDEHGKPFPALVTIVHGKQSEEEVRRDYETTVEAGYTPHYTADQLVESWKVPCINLVYVSGDPNKSDPYGRQVERASSVAHVSSTTAHGRYFVEMH